MHHLCNGSALCLNIVFDVVCAFPNTVDQAMPFSYAVTESVHMRSTLFDLLMRPYIGFSGSAHSGNAAQTVILCVQLVAAY